MTFPIEPAAVTADEPQPMIDPAKMPDRYALIISGDCMSPELEDGQKLLFMRHAPVNPGDFVGIFFRPEFVKPGHSNIFVKRLIMGVPPWVTFPWTESPTSEVHALMVFEQINPWKQFSYKCEAVLDVHYCAGVVPEGTDTVHIGWQGAELNGAAS